MRAFVPALLIAVLLVMGTGPIHAAVKYPFMATLDAQLTSGVTTVTSKITVRVERAMTAGFRTQVTDKVIIVTCIVSHQDGHSEENSLPGPADTSSPTPDRRRVRLGTIFGSK